jgi:hypothetical protein
MTNPQLNRLKYAVMVLGAAAIAAVPSVGLTAVASAEPGVWDIEAYDNCAKDAAELGGDAELVEWRLKWCCWDSYGVWDAQRGKCYAPPGDTKGSRQLPGNVQIPSDIATAPVTKAPPRPIQVPSDIATVSTVS